MLNYLHAFNLLHRDSEGRFYDFSSLTRHRENWEAIAISATTQKYYLNVCRPLVPYSATRKCKIQIYSSYS